MPKSSKGHLLGGLIGLKLWEFHVDQVLPSADDQASPSFSRELIGAFNLAENIAAAFVLFSYPDQWSPQFRKDLGDGIAMFARNGDHKIRIADVILLKAEENHFRSFYWQRIENEGEELVFTTLQWVSDAFKLVQEVRNLEFAAVTKAGPPMAVATRSPHAMQRIAAAMIECVHSWILAEPLRSEMSIRAADRIIEALLDVIPELCNAVMEEPSKD